MASVTQRISEIQQPYGGYLPVKLFSKEQFDDGVTLYDEENIHPSLVGLAVDYLTRFMLGNTVHEAFHISSLGASLISMESTAFDLKAQISGLDDQSIIAACKLVGYDVCYRASPLRYKPIEEISPNKATIENVRTMVNRSMRFWEKYGPIICSEPTFEGGYTKTVNTGDGDYVTKDAIWDFKVSKSAPKSKQTLQILMYYIMGLHSTHTYYKDIQQLGFYNPRLNIVYTCMVSNISPETIKEVEEQVIGYNQSSSPTSHAKHSKSINRNNPQLKANQHTTIQHTTVQRTITSFSDKTTVEYTVVDICSMTGKSKNAVYQDIHSGKLVAYKQGNKYVIPRDEYNQYEQILEKERNAKNIAAIATAIGIILFLIVFILVLSR